MIAGNVGSTDRVTYTIVGDAVNQAARLQVKTRDLGHPILLTESTRAALGGPNGFVLRPCGPVPLKGIAAPVEVYAVEAA
jgi:class 3 adenylate cyclase